MMKPDAKMTVRELLEHHPEALDFFIRHKMLCPGCPAEALHTLEEVSHSYRIPLDDLIKTIEKAITQNP